MRTLEKGSTVNIAGQQEAFNLCKLLSEHVAIAPFFPLSGLKLEGGLHTSLVYRMLYSPTGT